MGSKSYIGATVQLLRDMTTRGGQTFKAGLKMRVTNNTRAGLDLVVRTRSGWHSINSVSKYSVVVLEWKKKTKEE